jgi:hypothetical protein
MDHPVVVAADNWWQPSGGERDPRVVELLSSHNIRCIYETAEGEFASG